jgi:hypothetical protein
MAQRIKGQEVRVTVTGPAGNEESIGSGGIASFEIEFKTEILSEGYLGETTERKDDIFKGVGGRMTLHLDRQSYFSFVQRVTDRSQRRTASSARFNVLASLQFPNGQRPRVLLEDVFFGPLPVNVGGRDEYVEASIEFECAQGRVLF